MDLFVGADVNSYCHSVHAAMADEISALDDVKILNFDIDKWAEYFVSKYHIQELVVFEDAISRSADQKMVKKYNPWHQTDRNEPQFIMVDGIVMTYTIPFDGDGELLKRKPNPWVSNVRFCTKSLQLPQGDVCGNFTIELELTLEEIKSHADKKGYVASRFSNKFRSYIDNIKHINDEVKRFNKVVEEKAYKFLAERNDKALDCSEISKALGVSLSQDNSAFIPIPLKRVVRKPDMMVGSKQQVKEYGVLDTEYYNILDVIHRTCSMMEESPSTYCKLHEEELRDILLSGLGSHYEDMVAGEAFRKNGKTDIRIIFKNKAAFVGECKIWHGAMALNDAITQLLGYTTWKDNKVALIIFNKNNINFHGVRNNILEWIVASTKTHEKLNSNMWKCVLYREDTDNEIHLAIGVYDLYTAAP